MSVQPFFSEINSDVRAKINSRAGNNKSVSTLSAYIKAVSYADPGLVISSNPQIPLVAAGKSIYGTIDTNGSVGTTVAGKEVAPSKRLDQSQGLRPIPIITSAEIQEQNADDGASNFSRVAKFTIRCFSLGQMESVTEHFLEPGISIFLQWGWNTLAGSTVYNIAPDNVAKLKDFVNTIKHRKNSDYESDTYLGFVTGGEVSMQDDYWDITVNCRGFLELPAYLMAADNTKTDAQKAGHASGTLPEPLEYAGNEISAETNPGKKRWMLAFNDLPSNKRTAIVKGLESTLSDIGNFINFDEGVKNAINSTTKKGFWDSIFGGGVNLSFGTAEAELAEDTKIINDERYIRFGALMEIINASEVEGLKLGNGVLPFAILSNRTACSAFERIFSTDKTKLFIPNPHTPAADFATIAANGGVQTSFTGDANNEVSTGGGGKVKFPEKDLTGIIPAIDGMEQMTISDYGAGWLNALYVNFDFAKKILETKSLPIKDALYQILNGMSGAAGSIWDFQIVDLPTIDPKTGNTINQLHIVDNNLSYKSKHNNAFVATGANSPFLEVGMSMDISGQLSNQIMLEKSAAAANSSMPPVKGLFMKKAVKDMIQKGTEVTTKKKGTASKSTAGKPADAKEEAERKKRDFATFLGKVGLAPGVKLDNTAKWPTDGKILGICYQTAFDDLNLFESLKTGNDYKLENKPGTSILLPIELTLKMHGVSGIKRGDKISIDALPEQYREGGFFQVTSVTQTLNDDYWTTEIVGTFRTYFQ